MADVASNRAKGAAHQLAISNGTAFQVLLLKAAEADAALVDHLNVSVMLAAAGNTEADFTNYARKTGITVTPTIDNANEKVTITVPDQTWTAAGGAVNNTLVKAVLCVQTGADDTTLIPISYHDWPRTTDGSDLTLTFTNNIFYEAT